MDDQENQEYRIGKRAENERLIQNDMRLFNISREEAIAYLAEMDKADEEMRETFKQEREFEAALSELNDRLMKMPHEYLHAFLTGLALPRTEPEPSNEQEEEQAR